jgi:hypothetical protein
VNYYQTTKNFDVVECAGPPWCVGGKHFQSLMKDMEGEAGRIGRLASNTALWDAKSDTMDGMMRGLASYASKIAKMCAQDSDNQKSGMWWYDKRARIVIRAKERRREMREDKLGWMWARYQKQYDKCWDGFKELIGKEMELVGSDCGVHRDLRRRIVEDGGIQVQRGVNVWQAWMEVEQHEGEPMRRWGGSQPSERMDRKRSLIVCWHPKASRDMRAQAQRRWQQHRAVTVIVDLSGEEGGEEWFELGETEYNSRVTKIAVLGAEELEDAEGMREMIRHGLEKGERKGKIIGGGEVALRQ